MGKGECMGVGYLGVLPVWFPSIGNVEIKLSLGKRRDSPQSHNSYPRILAIMYSPDVFYYARTMSHYSEFYSTLS